MNEDRRGEKLGWIGGWAGGFIWVLVLSMLFLYQHKFEQAVLGLILNALALAAIYGFAPWRHPLTPYWKLMLVPYALFFISFLWAAWGFDGLGALGLNWWNLLWLLPALSPFGLLGNRRWRQSDESKD